MPAPLYLLDTGVVLNLVRANAVGRYLATTFDLNNPKFRPMVSIVSHGELPVLADRNNWGEKKNTALENALAGLVTIDIDSPEILDAYVEVDRKSRAHPKGARAMSDNDSWIAACAIATGAVLLTTDKDFLHLSPHLCKVQWVDPNRSENS